ncbi:MULTISPECIES: diadenylate cyclase CdaA [unclassified Clostridium]|uniref:diadenylate cyclase CdaA n=1 Tax=Clostridia TaxID=186801 RepID=UPI0011066279|nr:MULTISPECIES: diadenylate cyclase CdaA [unclassified Clostridium]
MEQTVNMLTNSFMSIGIWDILDIGIMSVLIYYLLKLTIQTRAKQVLKGLGILIVALQLSDILQFQTLSWLLSYILNSGIIIIVVLFQPELRRLLEQLGRNKILQGARDLLVADTEATLDLTGVAEEMARALQNMAKTKTGCLIVVERQVPLNDIIETGTRIDARLTSQLLENIFVVNTPLHDGAVVVRGGRIAAAGCFLPLSDSDALAKELGTRHRAAMGISENADCVTFLVSEETGVISMTREGQMTRYLNSKTLREVLVGLFASHISKVSLATRIRRARRERKTH